MAHDPGTAEKIRRVLSDRADVLEKGIVGGGLGFMVAGHLCVGLSSRGLTVRVGREGKADALNEPHVQPLMIGRKETAAFVVVQSPGYRTDAMLRSWIDRGLAFVATLEPR